MFLGEYAHQLDEKNRLRLPSKFKKELGKNYIVLKGTNGCLFVFSSALLNELFVNKLKEASLFDSALQKPMRLLLSSAYEVEEDNQGRVLLPKNLREYASLKKNLVFIGVGTHIEIWQEKRFQEYQKEGELASLLEGLKEYGI